LIKLHKDYSIQFDGLLLLIKLSKSISVEEHNREIIIFIKMCDP